MPGFRRAQLRGSEELFRSTEPETAEVQEEISVPEAGISPVVVSHPHASEPAPSPVPNAPTHSVRAVRLEADEIQLLADALQHLKFPGKTMPRPSMDDFEKLEELRQKLQSQI